MSNISTGVSLRGYNTFGLEAVAERYMELRSEADLATLADEAGPIHVLGGGSNILLTADVPGLVVRICLSGITVERTDEERVWVRVAGGEVWHELVLYAVARDWGGIENLALIPGTVGAAPIQNIGAYGVEVKDVIEEVQYWDIVDRCKVVLNNEACRFGYRDSIFKQELRGRVIVTSVLMRLSKQPKLNTSYGAINEELAAMGCTQPSVQDVAAAVINIRTSKLPDPKQIGNAGSFFKNPTISEQQYMALQEANATIPCYRVGGGKVKVPAAWLIEQCGWKGYRGGAAGVHTKQALVLVNYGGATGAELWDLSTKIVEAVQARYGIELEREVQVW